MKKFKTIYNYVQSDGVDFKEPSMTQQQFKDECDINRIMDRYLKTGVLSDPLDRRGTPKYGDYAEIGDYMEHMNKVVEANEMFEALPASIRKRFNNNPAELVEFVMDVNNRAEAERLGLVEKTEVVEKPEVVKEKVTDVNSTTVESTSSVDVGNN